MMFSECCLYYRLPYHLTSTTVGEKLMLVFCRSIGIQFECRTLQINVSGKMCFTSRHDDCSKLFVLPRILYVDAEVAARVPQSSIKPQGQSDRLMNLRSSSL